jgi:hypothetical protein
MSSKVRTKVWRASNKSETGFVVTDGSAKMVGSRSTFIAVDKEGIALSGNISFVTGSEQIRRGGLFLQMNDFARMIPSTIVTPIPPQIPFPPLSLISGLSRDLPVFLKLLG